MPACQRAEGNGNVAGASPVPINYTDLALWARVIKYARCADSNLDPEQWFPVSAEPDKARHEAATAITICSTCLVRAQCLVLSLRNWDIGQHGVWGGLVAADRTALRRSRHEGAWPGRADSDYTYQEVTGLLTEPAAAGHDRVRDGLVRLPESGMTR
jgi:hypothetical protein